MRHADAVTLSAATIIGAAIALAGVAIALAFNAWLERWKARKAERRERDRAIAELLAAVADLMNGIQVIRAGYDRSRWHDRIRRAGWIMTVLVGAFGDEKGIITRAALSDQRNRAAGVERLLTIDSGMTNDQRRLALDMTSVLLPRTSRFFAAVVVLTLGDDQEIVAAARKLTPAITALLDAIAAKDRQYARARTRAANAVGTFRDVVDRRRR